LQAVLEEAQERGKETQKRVNEAQVEKETKKAAQRRKKKNKVRKDDR